MDMVMKERNMVETLRTYYMTQHGTGHHSQCHSRVGLCMTQGHMHLWEAQGRWGANQA
jgi:hypothetical protein